MQQPRQNASRPDDRVCKFEYFADSLGLFAVCYPDGEQAQMFFLADMPVKTEWLN